MVLLKVMIVKQSTHPNNILPKKKKRKEKHILIIDYLYSISTGPYIQANAWRANLIEMYDACQADG